MANTEFLSSPCSCHLLSEACCDHPILNGNHLPHISDPLSWLYLFFFLFHSIIYHLT